MHIDVRHYDVTGGSAKLGVSNADPLWFQAWFLIKELCMCCKVAKCNMPSFQPRSGRLKWMLTILIGVILLLGPPE